MDLEKDSNREAFESWFESRYGANFMQFALALGFYVDKHTQTCWEAWQAAKAQPVPEGFVLVERFKLLQILGSAVAINTNPKTKINLLESDFIIGELKAMIEAQEPTND